MLQGRYGNDQLNRALFIAGMGLNLLSLFMPVMSYFKGLFNALGLICYILAILRMFSRKMEARAAENRHFLLCWNKATAWVQRRKTAGPRAKTAKANPTFEERRKYKYFMCNQCTQRMRVPRGKGKVRITCTRCGHKFDMKS